MEPARAAPPGAGEKAFAWPRWGGGFDLGPRALGHFGTGGSLNLPPGGVYLQAGYHYWYEHLIEVHAVVGLGLTSSMTVYGLGGRVNLFEFVYDPTGQLSARGLQRGLLVSVLRNFMIFGSLEYLHYGFPDPEPNQATTYDTQTWIWQPGLGVQWYFNIPTGFSRRWYLETSVSFTQIGGGKFMAPYLGLGIELK
jgi:hypothetical protein